jgi:hypothetical protein
MSTTTTEIQRIDVNEVASTMTGAPEVLTKNENLALKAVNGAQQLLDTIEAEGMSDELDAALNTWQVKAKDAAKLMNTRRSPITQIMTKMAKYFTEQEGKLDPAKADSIYSKVQLKRNEWARKKAEEQKAKEAAILKQQNIEKERISIVADIQTSIRSVYGEKLMAFKKAIINKYNSLTLENVEEVKAYINQRGVVYPLDKFREIQPAVFPEYLDKAEVEKLVYDEREKLYDELSANFRENLEAEKLTYLDLIPSRINELNEIAKAGAEEKRKLEEAAQKRKEEAEAKLKQDKLDQEERDRQKIKSESEMATAGTLFNSAAAMAEIKNDSPARVREGYKITVHNAAGWGALFLFYFEKEGQKLDVETFGKKTMNQMKAFCEKHAHKTGEKIDSDHLFYEEDFKAVATKG